MLKQSVELWNHILVVCGFFHNKKILHYTWLNLMKILNSAALSYLFIKTSQLIFVNP